MINLRAIVISDSTGETGEQIANSIIVQFPNIDTNIKKFSHINSLEELKVVFEKINEENENTFIVTSLVNEEMTEYAKKVGKEKEYVIYDLLDKPIKDIEKCTGEKALRQPGLIRELDREYFSKIDAIEFAVKYDDGRDSRGFYEADVVLIGVSRTSKTPLSILLAYKNYKAANLPLVPEIALPKDLYKIDSKKIVGLTINPDNLNEIRKKRMEALGLMDSMYGDDERIIKEIEYAQGIFDELNCKVINVSEQTIEQTATEITEYIKNNYK